MAIWYFAYGSNLNKRLMRRRIKGRWLESHPAVLRGYKLSFDVYSPGWNCGTANIIRSKEGLVHGAIYKIYDQQLKLLDAYEGVPHLYRRVRVTATAGGRVVKAIAYRSAKRLKGKRASPSPRYLATIIRGLKDHGYGVSVLQNAREKAVPSSP